MKIVEELRVRLKYELDTIQSIGVSGLFSHRVGIYQICQDDMASAWVGPCAVGSAAALACVVLFRWRLPNMIHDC